MSDAPELAAHQGQWEGVLARRVSARCSLPLFALQGRHALAVQLGAQQPVLCGDC